ncbi:MAG: oligopeptidase A [Gammaproteobacteria bacterium]|nr:MAG: oligopeptidase A [Gammaproteobacteria bacterium]
MSNPLLTVAELPDFSHIKVEDIVPAIGQALTDSREKITALVSDIQQGTQPTAATLLQPLGDIDDRLNSIWSPISHLNAVVNSDALREAYNACLPKLSEYSTWMGQNQGLYQAYKALQDSPAYQGELNQAQRKAVDNALRDFHLSGVDLPEDKKQRFGEIKHRLSELSSKYGENVLDANQAWSKLITDKQELAGVPDSSLEAFAHAASANESTGYWLTLDMPCYLAVMTYCENQSLREEMYQAYTTRASDQGPNAGEWDNAPLMAEILALRSELAGILGFNNYAECSIATKMTETTDQVMDFLTDLAAKSLPAAKAELEELQAFAENTHNVSALNAWDVPFYSEKLKHQKYQISQEELRPWFPLQKVIAGLFDIAGRLFGVSFQQQAVDTWHEDVHFYQVLRNGQPIAGFYLDLYARSNKRGGAWMADCRVHRRLADGGLQQPIAFLTCNFNAPVGDKPALLTHQEVTTLFHEFGHGLHHMLTRVEEGAVSGINGVPWDAVELPSQFLENWCWEPDAIALMSGHFESGEPLPAEKLERMLAAKNFQSAMHMVRQLEFALFDFKIHLQYQPAMDIHAVLDQVRSQVAVIQPPAFNRFENSFSHIFAGGYAAGYYSYKWAEVLSADAFSKFEEDGIFNPDTGRSFLENILEQGGSQEPMALFVAFRGRKPQADALLRHSGLMK